MKLKTKNLKLTPIATTQLHKWECKLLINTYSVIAKKVVPNTWKLISHWELYDSLSKSVK